MSSLNLVPATCISILASHIAAFHIRLLFLFCPFLCFSSHHCFHIVKSDPVFTFNDTLPGVNLWNKMVGMISAISE